jgi:hypothetical protein
MTIKNHHSLIKRIIALKPYTTKDLMVIYNVRSYKTWNRWIKPIKDKIGIRIGYYYSIPQVKMIFDLLELPTDIEIE